MYAKIYLPTKSKAYIERIAKLVSKMYGGSTIISNCVGFWENKDNQFVKDEVTIIETYITERGITQSSLKFWFEGIAQKVKRDLNQDSLAFVINNDIFFI